MYISRISEKIDERNKTIIIETLVLSQIDYCIRIRGTITDQHMSNVHKLPTFAAQVSSGGVRKYDHISPVFRELQWLRIKQKHLPDFGVAVFKVSRGFYPDWFLSFKSRRAITNGVTRQMQQLYVRLTNTHKGNRRTAVLGSTVWNTLPSTQTQARPLLAFKTK